MVNCSLFCPTPSLSAMLVNRFKMREDILSFNLGGMGCSAGVIAIGLAQRLLKTEPEKYALVVSTENITQVMLHSADPSPHASIGAVNTRSAFREQSQRSMH